MVMSVPSAGVGATVGGPSGSLSCQRAQRVPRARQKYAEGSSVPVLTLLGSDEAELVPGATRGLSALMTS
jgi:hypothetical protein